ncbi:hypothetical protein BH11MYX1_BH11MYX1_38900 [soil metagenome]
MVALAVVATATATAQPSEAPVSDPRPAATAGSASDSTDSNAPGASDYRDLLADAPTPAAPSGDPPTGTARAGAYHDSDQTTVWRFLGNVGQTLGQWELSAGLGVDAVTSASVDVRSSPALSKVDTVTSASGRSSTSGGQMTDTRYQGTVGAGWKGSEGRTVNLSSAVAKESDYASVSGGINGSFDLLDRTTTLLGGMTLTDNWVSSVIDTTIHRKMVAVAWSLGVARVLTPEDAIRLRYDGKLNEGYIASPYRSVRFGDWSAALGSQQITFMNVTDTLAEREPGERLSSAVVVEWVHSLAPGIGLHPQLRVSHDSWGVQSLTAGADLRLSRPSWRFETGYRFYLQSAADFFADKYVDASSMYESYTSDKELGRQVGHLGQVDLALVLIEPDTVGGSRMLLNLQLAAMHYAYTGFTLLPSRDSVFASAGVSWEF